jgi:hypothetical protein
MPYRSARHRIAAHSKDRTTSADRYHQEVIDDLTHRVPSRVKTTIADPIEQNVQRWFVASFCEDGFTHRRHRCADASMVVYQLDLLRSRELYDLTMLEPVTADWHVENAVLEAPTTGD